MTGNNKLVLIGRLISMTGCAAIAAAMVMFYSWVSDYRFEWEHQVDSSLGAAHSLANYAVYGFIIPLVVALVGIPCILKTPPRRTLFEMTIWVGLVASVVWMGLAITHWQLVNAPIITLMRE